MSKQIYLFVAITLILISCSGKDPMPINFGGMSDRANSYEDFKRLPNQMFSEYKFKSDAGGTLANLIELNGGGVIFCGKNGTISALMGDKVAWEYKLDKDSYVYTSPVADAEDNLYFIDNYGELISLDKDGKLRWKVSLKEDVQRIKVNGILSPIFNDLLCVNDGIVIPVGLSRAGYLAKYSFSGAKKFEYISTLNISGVSSDKQSNLFITGNDWRDKGCDSLIVLNSEGKENFSIGFENQTIMKYPVIRNDMVYLGLLTTIKDQKLSLLKSININDKKEVYSKEFSFIIRNISADQNGEVFFTCFSAGLGDNKTGLFNLDKSGNLKWKLFFDYSIPTAPVITQEEIALAGTDKSSMGMFYIEKSKGRLLRVQDLGKASELTYKIFVNNTGNMLMPALSQASYIKIDYTLIDKIMP